jgi:hypothetical protein
VSLSIEQYVRQEAPLVGAVEFAVPGVHHLSASAVNEGRRCWEQFRRKRVLGERERPGEARLTGSALHKTLERNFRPKITTGVDLPLAELLDWLDSSEGFAHIVAEEEHKAEAETIWDTSPAEAQARTRAMVAAYMNEVAGRIEPVNVEERFTLDWKPLPVVGVIDVETRGPVIDFKSSKQRRLKPKPDWMLQGVIYQEAVQKPVHFHVLAATEKTGTVSITTPLDSEHLAINLGQRERAVMKQTISTVANEIAMYHELLGAEGPWPTTGRLHEWACQYCQFQKTCPAWADTRLP